MPTAWIVIVIALAGGVAVGLQSPMTSQISTRVGVWQSVFLVHLSGAVAAALLLLLRGGDGGFAWQKMPWYALVAGVPGLVILGAVSYAIPRVGTVTTITLVVVGQLGLSVVIDHFGLLGAEVRHVDVQRLAGIAILMFGTWLVIR